ncbi:MAG: hypothetical protein OHK0037_26560 [Elainellaceae cyanobacterium]
MAFWEFLIQQEGDRSWLPLESPDVEVLEGRYRVVARSSRVNTPVEISIIQTIATEHPPRRRVQKRMGQTNPDGLLVVLPYTRLEPGAWELRCVGDLMSDMMGEGWGYGVKLQVLSHETDAEADDDLMPEDWHSHIAVTDQVAPHGTERAAERATEPLDAEELLETQSLQAAANAGDRPPASPAIAPAAPVAAEDDFLATLAAIEAELNLPESAEPASELMSEPTTDVPDAEADLGAIAAGAEDGDRQSDQSAIVPTPVAAVACAADLPPMRLVLHPDHYTAQWGGTLRIAGQVVAANPDSALETPALYLDLTLRDPQSGETLVQHRHELPGGALPRTVDCAIAIPDIDTTRLMLGEAALCVVQAASSEPFLLAAQSFTVTAALDDLLEAIANDFPADLTSPFVEEEELDLSLLNLVDGKPSAATPLPEARPAGDQVLPPQIFQPAASADAPAAKSIELPPWGNPLPGFENGMNLWQLAASVSTAQTHVTRPDSSAPPPAESLSAAEQTTGELTDSRLPDAQADWADEVADFAADPGATPSESTAAPLATADDDLSIYLTSVSRAKRSKSPDEPPPVSPRATVRAIAQSEAASSEAASSEAASSEVEKLEIERSDSDIEGLEAENSESQTVQTPSTPATPSAADSTDAPLEWNHAALSLGQPAPSSGSTPRFLSPEDRAFQALNLQHRFLSRLTALATDTELGALMQPGAPPLGRDLGLTGDEVVVEDVPLPPPQRSSLYRPEHAPEPPPVVLPAEEPVPSPVMDVPQGELTSGQRIEIGMALPDLEARFYIKLWLRDRQSRTVLDGPRWVMNFTPDGQGYQIAYAQITVPFGCVETQFEAIAVEMSTQRESRKVVQSRRVVPPNLPQLDVNDLGI